MYFKISAKVFFDKDRQVKTVTLNIPNREAGMDFNWAVKRYEDAVILYFKTMSHPVDSIFIKNILVVYGQKGERSSRFPSLKGLPRY